MQDNKFNYAVCVRKIDDKAMCQLFFYLFFLFPVLYFINKNWIVALLDACGAVRIK